MSLENFSTSNAVVTVNGRIISDFGESDPPYTDEPIDASTVLRRGLGGNAIRLDRINPGRRVTINLNPGSPDSAYMNGLFLSKANIEISFTQIGTLDAAIGVEGVITNDGPRGRAGQTITDDVWIMEFNNWTPSKGGA